MSLANGCAPIGPGNERGGSGTLERRREMLRLSRRQSAQDRGAFHVRELAGPAVARGLRAERGM